MLSRRIIVGAAARSLRWNSTVSAAAQQQRVPDPRQNTRYDKFPPLDAVKSDVLPKASFNKNNWYYVKRTRSGQLPVYSEYKVSDGVVHTLIRSIDGNAERLRLDLLEYLGVEDKKRITIKPSSGNIVIKYNMVQVVKTFLSKERQF